MNLVLKRALARMRGVSRAPITKLLVAACFCLLISSPAWAQFSGGTTLVDPTQGAQSLGQFLVDGGIKIAAYASVIVFFFGLFRLFNGRALEGLVEIAAGLIVFGLIGNTLGWASALTGVTIT